MLRNQIFSFLINYIKQTLLTQNLFCQKFTMASYLHLSKYQIVLMTILVVVSIFTGIPALIKVFKKGNRNFLATIFMMSMISSFFYHISEIYQFTQVPLFLSRIQWQRMDNVFTISSIQLMALFLCGTLHSKSHFLQYSTLINTIIIQQKDPWNFTYTVVPILFYLLMGIFIRIYNEKKKNFKVRYFKRNMILSTIFLIIGILFYLDGLDDQNDYLRFSHGMWHLCISVFGWYAFEGVQVTMKVQQQVKFIEPKQQSEQSKRLIG